MKVTLRPQSSIGVTIPDRPRLLINQTGAPSRLRDLLDVNVVNLTDGSFFVYNITSDQFVATKTIGNLTFEGNIISANGNLVLDTSGFIDAANNTITNLSTPINITDAATKGYIDDALANFVSASELNISGDVGTDTIALLNDTLQFVGQDGITTLAANNQIVISITEIDGGTY